jgi:hypothetical protein
VRPGGDQFGDGRLDGVGRQGGGGHFGNVGSYGRDRQCSTRAMRRVRAIQ